VSFLGCSPVKSSIRKIAEVVEISKSSAHRIVAAIKKRDLHPESYFWETVEGAAWLKSFFYGTIFHFGIRHGVGAEMISEFFNLLHLEKHIGVSQSSIRNRCKMIENLIIEFQETHQICDISKKPLKIVGGVDETFFKEMILVLMDLSSGYIFFEEASENRTYETWLKKTKDAVQKLNLDIQYFVSDRAKALVKLSETGFDCPSIPDLFHAEHEIVKTFGLSFGKKISALKKKTDLALAALALLKEVSGNINRISEQEVLIQHLKNEQAHMERGKESYYTALYDISKAVHPFELKTNDVKNSGDLKNNLVETLASLNLLQAKYGINDKNNRLEKFGRQVEAISWLIDYWWLLVDESLAQYEIDEKCMTWLLTVLLPCFYWKKQASKTKNPDLKKEYEAAFHRTLNQLKADPSTPIQIKNKTWHLWAEWMVSNFQRTSSAVEGRNGYLSQRHHNGRGLLAKRLKALTVIHNYTLKRFDGTTAADRLFGRDFPNLFEWVVDKMDDLPLPRQYKNKVQSNYLNLISVPA
jgi:hypothetical protein